MWILVTGLCLLRSSFAQELLPSQPSNISGQGSWRRIGQVPASLPTSVEVGLGSTLSVGPGQRPLLNFVVTNNRHEPQLYDFIVTDNQRLVRFVRPTRGWVPGKGSEQVQIELQGSNQVVTDTVSLTAQLQWGESVTKKALIHLGDTSSSWDSTGPYIDYWFTGDCWTASGPDTCRIANWGANLSIYDTTSGLLMIRSSPVALELREEFIAGTRDTVHGYFTTSCCQSQVQITATDTVGNSYTRVIDISKRWLSTGEIAAIVLAVILLLVILAAIIWCLVACCRRRSASLSLYPN